MKKINDLLDKAKLVHKLPSDYKLALVAGISFSAISSYRNGKTLPDARAISRFCELTGDDPAVLIAEIEGERAKTDEARALWASIARRLALTTAAGISAAVLSGCLWVGEAVASPVAAVSQSVYYVKLLAAAAARRIHRWRATLQGFFMGDQNEKALFSGA